MVGIPHHFLYSLLSDSFSCGMYERLILSGKPYEHLAEIKAGCSDRINRMIRQMADAECINEELKARNQLAWGDV